jgi:cobaltochelatase CobN
MHILATTSASLDDRVEPVDLRQAPGDVAFLSFTDSDLAAVAAAWRATEGWARSEAIPALRCETDHTPKNDANPPPSRGRAGRGGAAKTTPEDGGEDSRGSRANATIASLESAAPPLPALPREGGGFPQADVAAATGDSELGATAPPTLRLASLRDLRHPMSVDLWVDGVAASARVVVVRLLGGLDWWRYGVERLHALAIARTAAGQPLTLAVLPGCDRDDPRLAEFSTLSPERLAALLAYFREGGGDNLRNFARQLRAMAEVPGAGHGGREDRSWGYNANPPSMRSVGAPAAWQSPNPLLLRSDGTRSQGHNANPPPSRGRVGRGGAANSASETGSAPARLASDGTSAVEPAAPPLPTLPREGGGLPQAIAPGGSGALADGEGLVAAASHDPATAFLNLSAIPPAVPIPRATAWLPGRGALSLDDLAAALPAGHAVVPVIFYRSMLLADDLAPIAALCAALAERGLAAAPLAVASLKEPGSKAFVAEALGRLKPAAIITATAFAAGEPGEATLLDAPGVPVLQAIVATTRRDAWVEGRRGLASADMAMHVVLPELDGRVLAGALSFKDTAPPDPDFGITALVNRAEDDRVAMVADRVAALVRLQKTPPAERRLAVLLPDYPGPAGRAGYAVGLDVPASVVALLGDLAEAGWSVEGVPADGTALMRGLARSAASDRAGVPTNLHNANPPPSRGRAGRGGAAGSNADAPLGAGCIHAETNSGVEFAAPPLPTLPREGGGFAWADVGSPSAGAAPVCGSSVTSLPLVTYRTLFSDLPATVRAAVTAAWGDPAEDVDITDGAFRFRAATFGAVTVALPPDRGRTADRRADYHDPALPPCHGLVAFGLWLQHEAKVDAVVHMGAHGTFEWLPGKAVALTASCFPEVVLGPLPVVYPFIVTNPGEAAQAKRRIAAVTLGHLPPPLVAGALDGPLADLERLVDEYASADGLDGRRRERLAALILEEAERTGLARDAGASLADGPDEALTRIDAWLCDVKELSLKDGLHVYGRAAAAAGADGAALTPGVADGAPHASGVADEAAPALGAGATGEAASAAADGATRLASAAAERAGILAALDGRRVAAGPAGAPSRGRSDVLPTGRNLYTADPRAIPTPTAVELGRRGADEVVRLYLQEHGDWPRSVVLDLWGSATLRTGGEEIAQALALMGCRPVWERASGRVTGVEVLPTAALGRPRVDVTCRISGLFRDLFPTQIALLDAAVQAVAARDEDDGENPLAARRRSMPEDPLARVYGTAPGVYGSGIDEKLTFGDWDDRAELGRAYLAAASHAFHGEGEGTTTFDQTADANPPPLRGRVGRGGAANATSDVPPGASRIDAETGTGVETAAPPLPALPREGGGFAPGAGKGSAPNEGFAARVASADMLVHGADDPGRDLLEGGGDVGFIGGFAAAAELLGGTPDLVVLDTRNADRPVARPLAAEIARVVRGRALSKRFIAGQMRHGWRGATELAETVDRLIGFAETTGAVPGHLIDAVHAAYLGDPAVRAFLLDANPDAARLIARRFADARRRGLWQTRRNDVDGDLAALMAEAAE